VPFKQVFFDILTLGFITPSAGIHHSDSLDKVQPATMQMVGEALLNFLLKLDQKGEEFN
jgi:hypothetical protein